MASFAVPTASTISDVQFSHFTADEIKKISVKRIHVTPALDSFHNPTPGGLYDPALGCVLDKICTTCRMPPFSCPGHCGHVELAITSYNVSFLEQTLRLLRSQCVYCYRLKMPAVTVNLNVCRLRLLQYGLVEDLKRLENLHIRGSQKAKVEREDGPDVEMIDEEEEDPEEFIERRNRFVDQCIRNARKRPDFKLTELARNPTALALRKALIKQLLLDLSTQKKCGTCGGVSPSFRKDLNTKIFRRALPTKVKAQMVQANLHIANPLVYLQQIEANKTNSKKEKPKVNGFANHVDHVEEVDEDDSEEAHGAEEQLALNHAANAEAEGTNTMSEDDNSQVYLTSTEVYAAMKLLFQRNQELFKLMYNSRPTKKGSPPITPDMFFIKNVLVPPNKYRPASREGQDVLEAQQNGIFTRIIKANDMIQQIKREMNSSEDTGMRRRGLREYLNAGVALQEAVNSLIDQIPNPSRGIRENGIKQTLEKKEGLFRKNMMGKRVNFAARSVISPDPNIETNEIGVPLVFAKKLTFPEPVTSHNFYEMKDAVINGIDKYPGAAAIENELGQVLSLKSKTLDERIALANQLLTPSIPGIKGNMNKKVYRHLRSGDVVLMNRQPTLHKPSMMGHIARVLMNEKTIRMHYANCNTYNADFDGDEMNMHFPQNEIARAELMQIANTDNQYLSATAGKPLRGLIQDHISMGVQFTGRDAFFNREEYNQLLYSCLRPETGGTTSERIELLPPAIIKPRPMWTGKQVISTVLKNIVPPNRVGINLTSKSSTPGDRWAKDSEENIVIFRDGLLLCGILDKAQLGPSAGGMIHSVHELYGPGVAGKLLSILGRLLTRFLNMRAWSCGIDDLRLTVEGDVKRKAHLSKRFDMGLEIASKYVTLDPKDVKKSKSELLARLEEVLRDDDKQKGLDQVYSAGNASLTSELTKMSLPAGLEKPFPRNQMQAMTVSGAKGSNVNANHISCNLGQQTLEGRRVPVMVSGKTLPAYRAFETDPAAGGYVSGRFLTGINPKEFFFHAMAGREGLIDTAVKTAKSGYLQRCIIKGLEGVKSEYDNTVRETSTGSVIQFLYGEDGIDVMKAKYLTNFSFLAQNQHSVMADLNMAEDYRLVAKEEPKDWHKKAMKAIKKTGKVDAMDPVLAQFAPGSNFGSTSESFTKAAEEYIKKNPDKLIKDKEGKIEGAMSAKTFRSIMDMKYMRSLVEPGEAVGVVAAQSVGEPSTQMTLNTFHLAGHASKNVTLGIPRLREIVMTASAQISTPMMTLKLNEELTEEQGQKFAKGISRLSLAEVIDEITVEESVGSDGGFSKAKIYDVKIAFYPPQDYMEEYAITVEDVDETLRTKFIPRLEKLISMEFRKKARESTLSSNSASVPDIGVSIGQIELARPGRERAYAADGEEDNVDEDDDEDPDAAKNQRERQNEAYDDPEDEEVDLAESSDDDAESGDEAQKKSKPKKSKSRKLPQNVREENPDDSGDDTSDSDANAAADEKLIGDAQHVTHFKFSRKRGNVCKFTLSYDISTSKLLLLPILEKTAHQSIIQSIPGLTTCACTVEKTRDDKTGVEGTECVISTSGVNLLAMRDYQDVINPHSIYTNSIHSMLQYYGVEAARNTIVKEMDAVFTGHSISVDLRHLGLIADAMTQSGGYKAFSRMGVVKEQSSPFAKMSFETVMGFLREAVLEGESDELRGPSSRIVVGRHVQSGTGAFDLYVPAAGEVM